MLRWPPSARGGGDGDGDHYVDDLWHAWSALSDPGPDGDASDTNLRVVDSTITLCGIMFMSSIIGFIVDAINAKMLQLQRGRNAVVEEGHTLILGWTDK